jgi:hypothetical protein
MHSIKKEMGDIKLQLLQPIPIEWKWNLQRNQVIINYK